MRKLIIAAIILITAGCAQTPKNGTPAQVDAPQAAEQCKAQPTLEWCQKHEH